MKFGPEWDLSPGDRGKNAVNTSRKQCAISLPDQPVNYSDTKLSSPSMLQSGKSNQSEEEHSPVKTSCLSPNKSPRRNCELENETQGEPNSDVLSPVDASQIVLVAWKIIPAPYEDFMTQHE